MPPVLRTTSIWTQKLPQSSAGAGAAAVLAAPPRLVLLGPVAGLVAAGHYPASQVSILSYEKASYGQWLESEAETLVLLPDWK